MRDLVRKPTNRRHLPPNIPQCHGRTHGLELAQGKGTVMEYTNVHVRIPTRVHCCFGGCFGCGTFTLYTFQDCFLVLIFIYFTFISLYFFRNIIGGN